MSDTDAKLIALMVKLREKGIISLSDIQDIEGDTERLTQYLWGGDSN